MYGDRLIEIAQVQLVMVGWLVVNSDCAKDIYNRRGQEDVA